MALNAAGPLRVPVPGTKVAVSSLPYLQELGQAIIRVHGILFQALEGNSGAVRIYQLKPDGAFVLLNALGIPTTTFIPSFSASLTWSPNAIALTDLYLDADTGNNGALVTVLIS